jgi:Protein of unknown function (DUF3489)
VTNVVTGPGEAGLIEGIFVQLFTISADNIITVSASLEDRAGDAGEAETFSSMHELAALATAWPGTRLLEIWNKLPDTHPVQRFTSKPAAVKRIWKVIQHLEAARSTREQPQPGLTKGRTKKTAGPSLVAVAQPNSKAARLIALLKAPQGATLKAIMQAMGWERHSVRSHISRQVSKKMGLRVRSFKREGERVYAIKG